MRCTPSLSRSRCADIEIAVLPPSRIREDFRRAAITNVNDVTPSNWRCCWCANIAVLPQSLRRLLCSLAIAVLALSRIRGNRQRATIVIFKEVAPQNQRRFLTRQHCSLATIVEEVSAQSCHCSLTAVKNSRRTKDVGGVGNNQFTIQQRDFRHEQEEFTNKKLTERVRTEEVQMGRHDKQHIANTWEWNITTTNNREIGEDGNSGGQVTSQNWLGFAGGRVTRMRGISDSENNKCSTMPCALCCNLIHSFSSYYNHTFALVFHVLHLQIKKLFYMFAPVH